MHVPNYDRNESFEAVSVSSKDASTSVRIPARKVGLKIRDKIKTLEYDTCLGNTTEVNKDDTSSFYCSSTKVDRNMNLLHDLLERENSFETIQRKWEEITSNNNASSDNRNRVKVLVKPHRHHRQWASQTVCSERCSGNEMFLPSTSDNIIMIKEAQARDENESFSMINVIPSNSKNDLNTTGVNTEEPQMKSIGVNTSLEEEIELIRLRPCNSSRFNLMGKRTSVSRIPVPIKSPKKMDSSKNSELSNLDTSNNEKKEETVELELDEVPCSSFSDPPPENPKHPTDYMEMAMKIVNKALVHGKRSNLVASSKEIIITEWFSVAGTKTAHSANVKNYLERLNNYSAQLLRYVVNLHDEKGDTVLNYSAAYENFGVVSTLLDTNVCDPNKANKAGYNSIMLASLANLKTETEKNIVRRLFSLGDVNIKAAQHGQTALMLASSHGRFECAQLLVEAGADLNMQDEDGSTALFYAVEHGHVDIVQLLLAQQDCDPNITDNDNNTALNVAMDAGYKDIAVLLYAHMHFSKTPNRSRTSGLSSPCGHFVLAKRSVSTFVKSKNSESPEKQGTSASVVAKKQQSSIN